MDPIRMNDFIARRDFLRLLLVAGGAAVLSPLLKACSWQRVEGDEAVSALLAGLEDLELDAFFEQSYRNWLLRDPELLTALGLADAFGTGDAELTDISDAYLRQTQAFESGLLDLLRGYDRASLSPAQALTADVYDWFLDDLVRGHPFLYDSYPVNPTITSIPYNLYLLFTVWHPLHNRQDAGDYIARLSRVGVKVAQLIDGLQRRQELGVILPSFLIPVVLSDIDAVAYGAAPSHPFYAPFADRLTGVTDAERQDLLAQVEQQLETVVNPAYRDLSACLRDLQDGAPDRVGVWQFPDGEACYAQALRHQGLPDTTAEAINSLGLENVARIHAEMRPLFAELGYADDGSIPELFERLTEDSGVHYGQNAVAAYEAAIREAEALLPQAFDLLPSSQVAVVGGPEGDYYDPPPFDGSRPGTFYASTSGMTPRFGVKTLAFHETVPGHHLQVALAVEQTGLPSLRRGMQFNSYCEGWALYAERLMWELGAYVDDPQGNLGRLQAEVYRAARLVVDTGIHALGWSFDQAVETLMQATGFPQGPAKAQIARYSVWPGQAVSYYTGFLKFLELRQRAQEALGSRFDMRTFHRVVLENGALPLTILERQVDTYIADHS